MTTENAGRCAIYARYSMDEQNPMSIDAQITQCEKRLRAECWNLVEVFKDEAISGTSTGNRPDYNRMYQLAGERAFDVLLVNDLSRLARSTDLDPIVRRFRYRGVRVIGVQDHFDSDSPVASLQTTMSGATSQQTIEMISKRTHSAQEEIVRLRGGHAGGLAYGYKVVHDLHPTAKDKSGRPLIMAKRLEIEPKEAEVVKKIFVMYADEGLSTLAIAAHLNAMAIPSPGSRWERKVRRKGSWMASTISSDPKRGCGILNNELYRGVYVWNRTKGWKDPDTGKIDYRPRPKDEWITEQRPHLRIIDDDLWERARAARIQRTKSRGPIISRAIALKRIGGADSRYLLGSILRCGGCGARLIGDSRTDYICPSYASGACANDLRVRREEVHNALLEPLHEYLLDEDFIARVKAKGEADLRRMAREEESAARRLAPSKEMKRLDEQETALRALKLPTAAFNAALAALDHEREEIKVRADGSAGARLSRARALLAKVPQIVEGYRRLIVRGAGALSDPHAISAAREAVRRLLINGTIVLAPNAAHTKMEGMVRFVDLGDHLLALAGIKRRCKAAEAQQGLLRKQHVVAGARYANYLNVDLV